VCSLKESLDPDTSILYNDEISHNVWLVFPGCPLESSSPYRHHLIMICISHTPYFNENESEAVRDRLTVFPMAPSLLWIRSIILVWTHHWSLHTAVPTHLFCTLSIYTLSVFVIVVDSLFNVILHFSIPILVVSWFLDCLVWILTICLAGLWVGGLQSRDCVDTQTVLGKLLWNCSLTSYKLLVS